MGGIKIVQIVHSADFFITRCEKDDEGRNKRVDGPREGKAYAASELEHPVRFFALPR